MIRLILPEEKARFDQLLEERHYLHSARLGGAKPSLRGLSGRGVDGFDYFQWGQPAHQSPGAEDPLDAAPAGPAAVFCGQQQPVSSFARAPALSQSGLASLGAMSEATQHRLARALGPSGGLGGELCR